MEERKSNINNIRVNKWWQECWCLGVQSLSNLFTIVLNEPDFLILSMHDTLKWSIVVFLILLLFFILADGW